MTEIKDCPFCGNTPDIEDPNTFRVTQGGKWGALICCSEGPEVRTSYAPSTEWRKDAIKEWNSRPIEDAKDKRIAELETDLEKSRHDTSREIRNCLETERELAEARAALASRQWDSETTSTGPQPRACTTCHGVEPIHNDGCSIKAALGEGASDE
jgi:hypothetical protein